MVEMMIMIMNQVLKHGEKMDNKPKGKGICIRVLLLLIKVQVHSQKVLIWPEEGE